jgi:hypothetical protein
MVDALTSAADEGALVAHGGVSHGPTAVDLPHHVGGGNHDIRQKDLVEMGGPRDLAQRTDLDSGGVHVDEEIGDAVVLGDFGFVRAIRIPQSLCWAPDVQTFWPFTTKASPSRSARVLSACEVRPGIRF